MKRILSILLALVLLVSAVPFAFAADEPFRVVISLEGFTLGQGYYVEPTAYSLDQINDLVKKDGYGPYTEDTLTAGMAVLAMLNGNNLSYAISYGTWTDSGYLSTVNGIDNGKVNFPAVISKNGGPSNDNYVKNTDKDLGAGDYEAWAGWMTSVNDVFPSVSICNYVLKENAATTAYGNTYVIRVQFALASMDASLGYVGWDGTSFFTHANKDQAMIAYADCGVASAKAEAKAALEKLDATQEEVDNAKTALESAKAPVSFWQRIVNFFKMIADFFKNLFQRG